MIKRLDTISEDFFEEPETRRQFLICAASEMAALAVGVTTVLAYDYFRSDERSESIEVPDNPSPEAQATED